MKKLFSMLVLCICVLSAFCWADSKPGRLPTYLTLDQLDIKNNLNIKGYSLTNVGGISGNNTYISVGDQVTSRGLTDKGSIVCNKLAVNGDFYFDGNNLYIKSNGWARFGDMANASFRWSAYHSNNSMTLLLRTNNASHSGNFIIQTYDSFNDNYLPGLRVNPTLRLQSATRASVSTTEYLELYHNQTNAVIGCGKGSVQISTHTIVSGNLNIGKALSLGYEVLSDSGTITNNSRTVVNCTKNGIMSVTLPTAVGNQGLYFKIKKSGTAGAVSLLTNAAETIDGTDDPIYVDAQYDFLGIVSDNANWIVVDRYIQ